ncbi:MAG: hypothetical protein OEZ59_11415 [Deltaproteobacteria bacterium]|nr:hypothetical protein [Deltaproteobacteria bacterium]
MVERPPRPASTLVLLRDNPTGKGKPEVLLVQRPLDASFAPGFTVFPGGAVEEEDCDVQPDVSRAFLASAGGAFADETGPQRVLGHYLAAVRETFEETLLLLARPLGKGSLKNQESGGPPPGLEQKQMEQARHGLLEGTIKFSSWLEQCSLAPSLDKMVYFAHWITPRGLPVRFDTRFFAARAPLDQDVVLDKKELSGHIWVQASKALEMNDQDQIDLMIPTRHTLEQLAGFDSVEMALKELGQGRIQPILPRMIKSNDGGWKVLLPGDSGYNSP